MTPAQVSDKFREYTTKILATREAGQKEYAAASNAFANFEKLAADLNMPREKILWVYAMKHRDGIASWLNGHKSQREDVRGRIMDLIVYLMLLWAMIDQEEGGYIGGIQYPLVGDEHFDPQGRILYGHQPNGSFSNAKT